jgi:PAS domain S-box-containing protein
MGNDSREAIGREQLRLVMQQVPTMQAASVIVALVLSYVVRDVVPIGNILCFVLPTSAVAVGRIILYRRFLSPHTQPFVVKNWEKAYLLLTLISGIVWGSSAFLILPHGDPWLLALFVLVMASLSASTTVSHSSIKWAPAAFIVPAMMLYVFHCILDGGERESVLAMLILLYLIVMLQYSLKHHETIVSSIALQFENRKLLEESHQNEERLGVILDSTDDGILAVDASGKTIFSNRRFLELWRIPQSLAATGDDNAMLNFVLGQLVDPDSFLRKVKRLYGTADLDNDTLLFKDGRIFARYSMPMMAFGSVVGRLWSFRDITERMRAEDGRRESEERYQELFENANDIIFTIDLAGRFTAINKAAEKITGYTLDDALKMNISSIIAPEFLDVALNMLSRKGMGGGRTRYELEIICKDGGRIALEFSPRIIFRDGKPVGIQGIARDTTERKRSEEALRESEDRFRSLSEASLEGIMVHDQGVILDANRAFAQLFGYGSTEELVGKNGPDLLLTPESRSRILQRIQRKENGRIELTGVRKDGTTFAVETASRPMKYRGRHARIVSFQDLTDRKRDEAEKVKLQGQLQQAMKMEAIGRLAGGVAHDFNNILTIITGYCELLLKKVGKESPMCRELGEIRRAGERAASMTQQLLAFSRKQIIEPKVVQLDRLVAEIMRMLTRLIGEDISLQTITGKSPGSVMVDPGQFQQILMNLVVNARDAMPGGGKIVIETANVDLDEDYCALHPYVTPGRFVMLAVSDTGQGMSDEIKAHIFEPFFTTKERGSGTGLGLATTYGAVKQSGGSIEVYSEVGKGTTFKIFLPRVEEEEKPVKEPPLVDLPGGTETVLLVEDEDTVRDLCSGILVELGYRVTQARSGAEAIAVAGLTGRIDLLLTDVVMPGMSGKELATRLVPLHPETKVLFMSGYTDDAIVHHGVLDEGVSFIGKPYTPLALARKVREVLEKA